MTLRPPSAYFACHAGLLFASPPFIAVNRSDEEKQMSGESRQVIAEARVKMRRFDDVDVVLFSSFA